MIDLLSNIYQGPSGNDGQPGVKGRSGQPGMPVSQFK